MVIFFIYLFTFIHSIVAQGDGCVLIVPDFPLTPQD